MREDQFTSVFSISYAAFQTSLTPPWRERMHPPLIAVVLLATPSFGLVLDLIPAQVSGVLCPLTP